MKGIIFSRLLLSRLMPEKRAAIMKSCSLSRQNAPVASMYVAEPLTPRVPAHSLGLDPSGCAKGKNLNL